MKYGSKCLYLLAIIVILLALNQNSVSADEREVVLADFEDRIPCSDCGDSVGFRRMDWGLAKRVMDGTENSLASMCTIIGPQNKDLFLQGHVRRMYLSTKSEEYIPEGPNALSFWIKIPENSKLISGRPGKEFGVWTYHWRPGDRVVGGEDNQSLATDSMMHGYAFFSFKSSASGRWIRMILSPSAVQIARYYYHFYAGAAATDDLAFFPSLRQLQFHFEADFNESEKICFDQLKLIHRQPTARIIPEYWETELQAKSGPIRKKISIKNPTGTEREYRVFISSFIGVNREVLHRAFAVVDDFYHTRRMQSEAGGGGGIGAVELQDKNGLSLTETGQEIKIPAGGLWEGFLVYHMKPDMLGPEQAIDLNGNEFRYRKDTLTTSVIVWDTHDEQTSGIEHVNVWPSNADDGNHVAPPGFPRQVRPPEGWRSEDIPVDQVGGYFVSVIHLREP